MQRPGTTPSLRSGRSLPTLMPLQSRGWLGDPSTARLYDTSRPGQSSMSTVSARSSKSLSPAQHSRSELFYESMEHFMAGETVQRSNVMSSCRPLTAAGHISMASRHQKPDVELLHSMGYKGSLYSSVKHHEKLDALFEAQKEGDVSKFRAALRGAQLHIGLENPTVLHMYKLLQEADWGVRECKKCSVGKLSKVLLRMKELDLGPSLWLHSDLAAGRARFAAWKASQLQSPNEDVRKTACDALAAWGEAVGQHAPDLADCLADESFDVEMAASQALSKMGEAGACAAGSKLDHPSVGVRKRACYTLTQLGSIGAAHAAEVVEHLGDPEADMRRTALLAFESFGIAGAAHADSCARCLTDPDAGVRRAACQALGVMGTAASPFIDAIKVCARDADVDVQHKAQDSLAAIADAERQAHCKNQVRG